MSLQSGIFIYLKSRGSITSYVGTGDNARIHPLVAPQGTTSPYIVYNQISNPHMHQLSGSSGFAKARIQLNAWSDEYDEAQDIAEVIRDNIDGLHGVYMGTVDVQSVLLMDNNDEIEYDPETEVAKLYGVRMDYEFWYSENVPIL